MIRRSRLLKASGMFTVIVLVALMPFAMSCDDEEPDEYTYCGSKETRTLWAGQHIDAGDVVISNNADTLYVEFVIDEQWYLVETHVAVGATVDDIPQTKKNNPIPGHFDYSASHSTGDKYYIYEIKDLPFTCGQSIVIAAHAVVRTDTTCGYEEQTGWGDGPGFKGKNWATYIEYKLRCCKVPTFPEDATAKNVLVYSTGLGYWQMQFSGVDSGYDLKDGNYVAWCIQSTVYISAGQTYSYSLYSSLNPPSFLQDDDWDLINYILNMRVQGYYYGDDWGGPDITNTDIQIAIWHFMEQWEPYKIGTTLVITEGAQAIIEDAIDNGEGFHPGYMGSDIAPVEAIILYRDDNTQRIIIELDP